MRELLQYPDLRLAQEIDALEKHASENDAELRRFRAVRSELSRIAWSAFSAALDCDSGPLSRTGVMIFPLHEGLAAQLLAALLESRNPEARTSMLITLMEMAVAGRQAGGTVPRAQ